MLTADQVTDWLLPPTKGGLKLSELREKAKELGLSITNKTKKDEIKEMLMELVGSESDDDEEESDNEGEEEESDNEGEEEESDNEGEEEESDNEEVTADQVAIWLLSPTKGGLKLTELRKKAKELGLDVTNKTKKDEIKEMLMELVGSESDDDEECDDDKTFEVYLESPGAKKDKFWKCTVIDCEMTTSYGVVGSSGTSTTKNFNNNDEAIAAARKLIEQKIAKGYVELEYYFLDTENGDPDPDPDDEEDTKEDTVCKFVSANGAKCTTTPKNNAKFCGKHKNCKASKDTEDKQKVKTKSACTGQCLYIFTRKDNGGKRCDIKPKGEDYCAKHASTQQAINYKANESPVAKKKLESDVEQGPKIIRNAELKVWIVKGENLVVKSPKNHTVYAYLTTKGVISTKLTKAVRILAEKLGLNLGPK